MILLLACHHRAEPADAPPADAAPAEAAPADAPPASPHPGQVVFVDRDAGTTETREAASLPETIAWYTSEAGRVPVVRIESSMAGGVREVLRYGPDGALLDVTRTAPR